MTSPNNSQQLDLIGRIVENADDRQLAAIKTWTEAMISLRESGMAKFKKAKSAIRMSMDKDLIVPVVKTIATESKRLAWDDRGLKARSGLIAAVVAALTFGGQGAGIAALGGAIGVPLWVVFGAGGAFAASLYEEASAALFKRQPKTTYTDVIEAEKVPQRSDGSPSLVDSDQ